MTRSILLTFGTLLLAACAGKSGSGLDRSLYNQTVGPAIIASFNEMCGATRIDEFRLSYLNYVGGTQPLNDAQKTEVLGWFDRVDADAQNRIPAGPERDAYCVEHPANQDLIDQGIAGDFTGMI